MNKGREQREITERRNRKEIEKRDGEKRDGERTYPSCFIVGGCKTNETAARYARGLCGCCAREEKLAAHRGHFEFVVINHFTHGFRGCASTVLWR